MKIAIASLLPTNDLHLAALLHRRGDVEPPGNLFIGAATSALIIRSTT